MLQALQMLLDEMSRRRGRPWWGLFFFVAIFPKDHLRWWNPHDMFLVSYQPPVQVMQPWMEHGVFFRMNPGEHAWYLPPLGIDVLLGKPEQSCTAWAKIWPEAPFLSRSLNVALFCCFYVWASNARILCQPKKKGSYGSWLSGFQDEHWAIPDMLLQRAFQVPERWSLACLGAVRSGGFCSGRRVSTWR